MVGVDAYEFGAIDSEIATTDNKICCHQAMASVICDDDATIFLQWCQNLRGEIHIDEGFFSTTGGKIFYNVNQILLHGISLPTYA